MIVDDDTWIQSDEEDNFPSTCPDILWNELVANSQKSGWLKKLSRGLIKKKLLQKWSFRFFALNNNKLYYFKDPSNAFPSGVIDFDQVSMVLLSEENMMILKPQNSNFSISLRLYNEPELSTWRSLIENIINSSKGKQLGRVRLGKKDLFWKFERIPESEFIENADTGDILLFRSENFASKLTRTFTRSTYDHVALIIKYVSGKVALLEATNAEGVSILMWDDFIGNKWHTFNSRLVWRRLNVEKTDEMMMKLEEFVQKVQGKSFNLTASKILNGENVNPGDEAGFFCSELVASGYKAMGVISTEFCASKYWPQDFSKEKEIIMEAGARLDRELLIDFEIE